MKREGKVTVSDSTCLIALERIGRLELLQKVFEEVWVPPAVLKEVGQVPGWIAVISPTNWEFVQELKKLLGEGEAEAIALAKERGAEIILDDKRARRVAKEQGLKVVGTLGVLIRARSKGIVRSVSKILSELESKGFFRQRGAEGGDLEDGRGEVI